MVHESKEVCKPKIGLGSTARAMHDQHAVNSARMRLTASIKPRKYVCAYKKGAPNNPSLRYYYNDWSSLTCNGEGNLIL